MSDEYDNEVICNQSAARALRAQAPNLVVEQFLTIGHVTPVFFWTRKASPSQSFDLLYWMLILVAMYEQREHLLASFRGADTAAAAMLQEATSLAMPVAEASSSHFCNITESVAYITQLTDPCAQQFVMRGWSAATREVIHETRPEHPFDLLYAAQLLIAMYARRDELARLCMGEFVFGPDDF